MPDLHSRMTWFVCAALLALAQVPAAAETKPATTPLEAADGSRQPKTRKFRFHYTADINELKPGTKAQVWVPLAQTTPEQTVEIKRIHVPGKSEQEQDKKFGNMLLYFEAAANDDGVIPVNIEYVVERREVLPETSESAKGDDAEQWLTADKMVPIDKELVERLFPTDRPTGKPSEVAYRLYQRVEDHMRYDKTGEGWGRGDARWACDSRHGNCTDFHSLFISLCRNLKIPAKFEIGFPLPAEPKGEIPGYHCWAKFADNDRWIAVDISEADKNPEMKDYYFGSLTADRVTFTTGRDLTLNPPQKGEPVNFLIYPYVEVEGKPHTKLLKKFRFEDME